MAETTKTPTTEQRRKALDLAVNLGSAHTDLINPGNAVMLFADMFANYLATGALPTVVVEQKRAMAAGLETDDDYRDN